MKESRRNVNGNITAVRCGCFVYMEKEIALVWYNTPAHRFGIHFLLVRRSRWCLSNLYSIEGRDQILSSDKI